LGFLYLLDLFSTGNKKDKKDKIKMELWVALTENNPIFILPVTANYAWLEKHISLLD